MEMIGAIFKLIGKLIYFTFPVWFLIGGISMGVSLGLGVRNDKLHSWESAMVRDSAHEVTVVWDNGMSNSRFTVYDNQPWTLNGSVGGNSLYADSSRTESGVIRDYQTGIENQLYTLNIHIPSKTDCRFQGLYSSPEGGVQYTNASGYGIRSIVSDMTLYAIWAEV